MFYVILFDRGRTHMPSTRLAILHLAVIHLRDSSLIKKVTSPTFVIQLILLINY